MHTVTHMNANATIHNQPDACPVYTRACPMGLGGIIQIWLDAPDLQQRLAPLLRTRTGLSINPANPDTVQYAILFEDDTRLDETLIAWTATGAEINCHGGSAAVSAISASLQKRGFHEITPHAWWAREVKHQRLSLPEWEARLAWMHTQTLFQGALVAASWHHIKKAPTASSTPLAAQTAQWEQGITLAPFVRRALRPYKLALCGAPNVGKSTLMNRLLGADRALVSDIAGTTRDSVHAMVQLDGLAVELIDTAGFLNHASGVDAHAVNKTRTRINEADLCLLICDASRCISSEDLAAWEACAQQPTIVIHNKNDRAVKPTHFNVIDASQSTLRPASSPMSLPAPASLTTPSLIMSVQEDPNILPLVHLLSQTLLPERATLETALRKKVILPITQRQALHMERIQTALSHEDAEAAQDAWNHLTGNHLSPDDLRAEMDAVTTEHPVANTEQL